MKPTYKGELHLFKDETGHYLIVDDMETYLCIRIRGRTDETNKPIDEHIHLKK